MPNATAAQMSLLTGFQGAVNTVSMACVNGSAAIGEAFRQIRNGYCDVAAGRRRGRITPVQSGSSTSTIRPAPQGCEPFTSQLSAVDAWSRLAAPELPPLLSGYRLSAP
jgi:hypothetical protein